MLRTTISKLRQVCALTFVPRLLRGDIRYAPDRFEKLSVCVQRRVDKSTSSSKQDQDDCERCQRIIDRAFTPNPPYSDIVDMDTKHKESFMNMITPEVPTTPENQCEKCQRIINQIFGEENAGDRKRDTVDPVCIPITELQATTAKENAETLAQKIEHIDETPLVEAPAKTKIEGFNSQPKVLGSRKKRRIGERVSTLHYSSDKTAHGRRKGTCRKDGSFDELAKRCLDSPSSHIDERLLKEMEKLGVPPTSRRGSRRTTNDAGIVQPEIMRRPRRPVAKTELDFLAMRRARLLRLNSDLPPPFELTPVKADSINLVSFVDHDDGILHYERIPPFKEQILSDVVAMSDDAEIESLNPVFENRQEARDITYAEERPPQQLLGHMTAAVMSDDSNMMSERGNEVEQLMERQEQQIRQFKDVSSKSGVILKDHDDEKISLAKLRELENEHEKVIAREKLASTHILSELVDPKEISPRSHSSGMIKEEIEMLKNLLRTRVEYLTQERIKRLHPKDDPCTDAAPEVDRVIMKEFTESEVNDTLQQLGVDKLRQEKLKTHHLKEDLNIAPRETLPFTEPSVLIKECTGARPMREPEPIMMKSYSQKEEMVTPHQLFEELSIISRETEIGVIMDELYEVNKDFVKTENIDSSSQEPPKNPSPGQPIDNVGMVTKDNTPSYGPSTPKGPHITLTEKFNPNKPLIDPYDKRCHSYESDEHEYDGLYTFDAEPKVAKIDENIKLEPLTHNVQSSRELKPLDETSEDPVIAVEMGRLPQPDRQMDHKLVTATNEPTLREPMDAPDVTREAMLNPLIDKGTVAHVDTHKLHPNMAPETTAIPADIRSVNVPKERSADKPIPLSELLKRVRERNRVQFCRQYEVRMAGPEVDPLVGECGKKNPPCPPPAPTCPPPPPKPCPPTKPPCPNPCKPKCPPTCPPTPCDAKPKCPPPKKSPCEKFQKCKCSNVKIQDALTLLLYLGPQFHIPNKSLLPFLACACNSLGNVSKADSEVVERVCTSLHNLCTLVLVASVRNEIDALESAVTGKDTKDYAKTYDPWTPIPSWPIPVKDEKKKLVCPKEGCKVIPPKLNPPCRDINPCLNFPKKHFSIIDLFTVVLGQQKMVYDIGDF